MFGSGKKKTDYYKLPSNVLFRLDIIKLKETGEAKMEVRTAGQVKTLQEGIYVIKMLGGWIANWGVHMMRALGSEEVETTSAGQSGQGEDARFMKDGKYVEQDSLEDLR